MKKLITLAMALLVGIAAARGQGPDEGEGGPAVRFEAVEVYVDSGKAPLAAYQFELAAEVGEVTIVGIEGGEHAAFKEPPYYDPAALRKHRVIIAAFSTGRDLPVGRTRVARIHVMVTGEVEPQYVIDLQVAAASDGKRIKAEATLAQGEEK